MNPTDHNAPGSSPAGAPAKPQLDAPLSKTEPTSGPAGSSFEAYKSQAATSIQSVLDSGKQSLDEGKKWLANSDLADKAKELPQKAKDLGSQVLAKINGLSTTQKAVGVGLLTAGVAFLATRSRHRKPDESEYRHKARRSPFAKKGGGPADDHQGPRAQQRPWGSSRYGTTGAPASGGKSRVSAGSGYSQSPGSHSADHGRTSSDHSTSVGSSSFGGNRRDQGPASGSRYDAKTSGSQNPNNADQLNSAF